MFIIFNINKKNNNNYKCESNSDTETIDNDPNWIINNVVAYWNFCW